MSRLDDALNIRDRILSLMADRWESQGTNLGPMLGVRAGGFLIMYRTPLQYEVLANIRRQRIETGPPHEMLFEYGLDVWSLHKKVMNIEWDRGGAFHITTYRQRGSWESELGRSLVESCAGVASVGSRLSRTTIAQTEWTGRRVGVLH